MNFNTTHPFPFGADSPFFLLFPPSFGPSVPFLLKAAFDASLCSAYEVEDTAEPEDKQLPPSFSPTSF